MQSLPSSFQSNLSAALNELLNDVDQIRSMVTRPQWKRMLTKSGKNNEVLFSRIVFDLIQANDHIVKTREQLSAFLKPAGEEESKEV